LIQQVDTKLKNSKKTGDTVGPLVPYSKLYAKATKADKILLYIGWLAAIAAGIGIPSWVFILGNVLDAFNPSVTSTEEMLSQVKKVSREFVYIACGIWFLSYLYFLLLL
jgi:hypothetical protein